MGDVHQIVIIIGSESDQKVLVESGMLDFIREACVSFEVSVISSHRHLKTLIDYCNRKAEEGTVVFIGAAGLSAALPGIIGAAIHFSRPVIGVALESGGGFFDDSLLAISRFPKEVPVVCAGVGKAGFFNAAVVACQILAAGDLKKLQAISERLAIKKSAIGLLCS